MVFVFTSVFYLFLQINEENGKGKRKKIMTGLTCAVGTCKSNAIKSRLNGEGLRFFTFPRDPKIRKQWVEKCYRKDTFSVKYKRICSKHFKLEDFEDLIKAKLLNFRPVRLKKDAIPSLLLGQFNNDEEKTSARSERALIKERKALVNSILENSTKPKAQAETNPECLILERKAWVRSHLENLAKFTNQTVENKKTGCLIIERNALVRSHLENSVKFSEQAVENSSPECPVSIKSEIDYAENETSEEFTVPPEPERLVGDNKPFIEYPITIKPEIILETSESTDLMVQALQEENQLLKCQVTDLQRKCADLESRVAHTEKQLEEVNSSFNERAKQLYKEVLLANEIDMIVVS